MDNLYTSGLLISKINFYTGRLLSKILKAKEINEINHSQGKILFMLRKKDNIPINDLAKELSLGKSTLTSMLDRLEENGYVVRKASNEDRRKIKVSLNPCSISVIDKYKDALDEIINKCYSDFSQDEICNLENYLNRIYKNLQMLDDK